MKHNIIIIVCAIFAITYAIRGEAWIAAIWGFSTGLNLGARQ